MGTTKLASRYFFLFYPMLCIFVFAWFYLSHAYIVCRVSIEFVRLVERYSSGLPDVLGFYTHIVALTSPRLTSGTHSPRQRAVLGMHGIDELKWYVVRTAECSRRRLDKSEDVMNSGICFPLSMNEHN